MKQDDGFMDRAGNFLAGKGFYIVLFLCVAVIGVSAWAMMMMGNHGESDLDMAATEQVAAPDGSESSMGETGTEYAEDAVNPAGVGSDLTEGESDQASAAARAEGPGEAGAETQETMSEAQTFVWPLEGEIVAFHSTDNLVYDQTMADWRTHAGVDVAAELGTQVMAISSGVVERVYEDELHGMTVVIDHGNELASVYSNLAATPTVSQGDPVTMGQVLGAVGETAIVESGIVNHLHLEVISAGVQVDPIDYLP